MHFLILFFSSVFFSHNPLSNSWLLSDASITACPGGSGQFILDGYDQNCYDTDDGRICHEMYLSFDDDGGYSMRVETGERNISYSYVGIDTVDATTIQTCDPDIRACEEMSYQIRGDEMTISGMMGCTGTMTFERVRADRD